MWRALGASASGMEAQELKISVVANNIANVNTTAFKKARVEFQDLLYENLRNAGQISVNGQMVPQDLQVGHGVRSVATLRDQTVGVLRQTGNPLDVAIEGAGYFQIQHLNGQLAFTRDGSFRVDAQGRLVTSDGFVVEPSITVPQNATEVSIGTDGSISVVQDGRADTLVEIGRLQLATFINPAGLRGIGHNLYQFTPASGDPINATPGDNGAGILQQRTLEASNVKVVEEMIDLIATQRAYETNTRVIKAIDEMLSSTAQMR